MTIKEIQIMTGNDGELYGQTLRAIKPSAIACDIPTPSIGDVPRPNSSTKTRDFGDASPVTSIQH